MRVLVELIFLIERHANLFVRDLVEVMRAELNDLGVASTVAETYVPARQGLIHVVMSATGWRWLAPDPPTSHQWARSLLVCFDQPNSAFFEREISLAPGSGGVFDINPIAIDAWRHHGFEARPLQLGYSKYWDASAPDIERDIDVIVLSGWTARRARHLASYARLFGGSGASCCSTMSIIRTGTRPTAISQVVANGSDSHDRRCS